MTFVRVEAPTTADEMRAYLERKAARDDMTGCLIWQAHASLGKHPQMRFGGTIVPARRVIFQFLRGPAKPERQIGVRAKCHCLCVDPEHLVSRTKAQAGKGHVVKLATKVKIAQTRRRQSSKLDSATVQAIRNSDNAGRALAEEHQVSNSLVSRIRRGSAWREYTGPWAGLMRA